MIKQSSVSTILSCLGVVGVIGTTISVAKAAPKASLLLQRKLEEKAEPLTNLEKIKIAAPIYIPSVIIGASTIACILGSNFLNKRYQASLASAYALLDSSYRDYKNKVKELYGEDADEKVITEIAKDKSRELPEGEILFYDHNTLQYFNSTFDEVFQKIDLEDGMECYAITTPFDTLPSWMSW